MRGHEELILLASITQGLIKHGTAIRSALKGLQQNVCPQSLEDQSQCLCCGKCFPDNEGKRDTRRDEERETAFAGDRLDIRMARIWWPEKRMKRPAPIHLIFAIEELISCRHYNGAQTTTESGCT